MAWLVAFARFWYDFIVGDSIILAIGSVGLLALGWFLVRAGIGTLAEVLLPIAVLATLVASLWPLSHRA